MQYLGNGLPGFREGRKRLNERDAHLEVGRHQQHVVVDRRRATRQVAEILAAELKVLVQLPGELADHRPVAAFLCGVERGEQTVAQGDEVSEPQLALGVIE